MASTPFIICGSFLALMGAYTFLNAARDFEAGMHLRGVNPNDIDERSRRSGTFRNRVGGAIGFLLGLAMVVAGLLA